MAAAEGRRHSLYRAAVGRSPCIQHLQNETASNLTASKFPLLGARVFQKVEHAKDVFIFDKLRHGFGVRFSNMPYLLGAPVNVYC